MNIELSEREKQLKKARELSDTDLKAQIQLITDTSHRCLSCFYCACVIVLKERWWMERERQLHGDVPK